MAHSIKESLADLSNWMANLPHFATAVSISKLAIPGAHDCGSFWLDPASPISPDESSILKWLGLCSCTKRLVEQWSITQSLTFGDQLKAGIRYFDIRTGYLKDHDDFHIVHGLYGREVTSMLLDVKAFLTAHPKEVVILDFGEFESFTDALHVRYASLIEANLQSFIFRDTVETVSATLQDVWSAGKQVFIIYHNASVCTQFKSFWSADYIYSPWPNTDSLEVLETYLNSRVDTIKPGIFNVFQGVLTPQTSTVLLNLVSSLKDVLGLKSNSAVRQWLDGVYSAKRKGVCIVMCDFVDYASCVSATIQLNELLSDPFPYGG